MSAVAHRRLHVWPWIVLAAILGVAIAYQVASERHRRGVVDALPPDQRSVLFTETMGNYRRICVERMDASFEGFCAEQRRFLRLFPECDQPCQQLVAPSAQPTR